MKRQRPESGFALLLVFVMAAAIAITLYMEVPRIAFESQRTREQMTIDHAHQYVRAIQLFYRKYQLYPQTLDDLETTRNIRFLRYRYLDPLTGKPFRLLHVGPAGQLTDSLVQPPAPLPGSSTGSSPNSTFGSSQSSSSSQAASTQSSNASQPGDPNNPNDPNAQAPDPLNMAARRPSDRIIGGPGGGPGGNPGGATSGNPGDPGAEPPPAPEPDPNQPQQPAQPIQQPIPGVPVQQPGDPNQPANPQDPNQPVQPAVPGQPTAPQDPSQPAQPATPPVQFPPGLIPPSGSTPGQSPNPTAPAPAQNPTPLTPSPAFPIQQAGQQGGQAPGQPAQQSAANLIQQLLTTPRQPPSAATAGFTSGNTGGIAGVASTADGKGIHKVNDRVKYKEWEFVYDLKKDKTVVGAAAVNAQQNVQQQMQQNAQPLGAPNPTQPPQPGPNGLIPNPTYTPGGVAPGSGPSTPPPSQ
ncbi:MAG: hypothetical protein ACLPWF_12150 [Bryobacteraceae bacterium]